jgi:protein SCO1/2
MNIMKTVSVLGLVVFLAACTREPEPLQLPDHFEGVIVESPAVELPDFELINQNGEAVDKSMFKGKWSMVFFGYMNCPDVCPTSLTVFQQMKQHDIPPTEFVFATVDPGRDTPEKLKEFLEYFDKSFIGLTGKKSEIDKFTDPLGVIYSYEGDTSKGDYIVNHFAAMYIIDPKARMRAYILPPHQLDRVMEAYTLIREYYER